MSSTAIEPRRVLVTGSAGMIGQIVCRALRERGHRVRGLDRRPSPGLDDCVVCDLTDARAVIEAGKGLDTLVHLAAIPDVADFRELIVPANVVGLYNACESARLNGHRRLVLTSSAQVVSGLRGEVAPPLKIEHGVAPTNFYALSKVLAEEMGRMYARVHRMSVIAVRPGHLPRHRSVVDHMRSNPGDYPWYLGPGDAGDFFSLCVQARDIEFAALFATSRIRQPLFDLSESKRVLGWEPRETYPEGLDELQALIDANPPAPI